MIVTLTKNFILSSNYLKDEAKNIRDKDENYRRQTKILRSVLLGDLSQSIVTASVTGDNK